MNEIVTRAVTLADCGELAVLVGELLQEIMALIGEKAFNFERDATELRAKSLIADGKVWAFFACSPQAASPVGFITLYESYALYAEGAYGTIPELYVRPAWRSQKSGKLLLDTALEFAEQRGWRRLEVTTPPLPQFKRTLAFYQANGFAITGGRKLKIDLAAVDAPG